MSLRSSDISAVFSYRLRARGRYCAAVLCATALAAGAAGCGARAPEASEPNDPIADEGPRWLEGIARSDVLAYDVESADGGHRTVRLRVEQLVRRGHGVAARLVPLERTPDEGERSLIARWLAGDETGLYQISDTRDLADPGFVPLDSSGRVVTTSERVVWRIPREWQASLSTPGSALDQGWAVDELDLVLDGPVRGDRCARIVRQQSERTTRLLVCANLGIVEALDGDDQDLRSERWRLVEVTHDLDSHPPDDTRLP